jgi:predicted nucleotide-binding protein
VKECIASWWKDYAVLRERGLSLLVSVDHNTNDSFIKRKLVQIEEIQVAEPVHIETTLLRRPPISRDSQALAQGAQIAPHQRMKAICLSAARAEKALSVLEASLREAAAHLARSQSMRSMTKTTGTKVFIGHGHSPLWRELKDFIGERLGLEYEEFNRVPVAGRSNVERLSEMLDFAAAAFVVLTAEDENVDGTMRARMNAIHEAGLFQGRLGFNKAIVLMEAGCEPFSNIEGLGQIRFPRGNIAACFEEVRRVLEREGLL